MKVLILTEGGKKIGFGHLTRCVAISDAIKRGQGPNETMFMFYGDAYAEKFLALNRVTAKRFDWHGRRSETLQMVKGFDAVVIDSYFAKKDMYDKISEATAGRLLMIDDYKRINYPPGIVVNPSIYGNSIKYPQRKGVRYLVGKNYIILRREFWNVGKKAVKKTAKNILITFGGINRAKAADQIAEALKKKFKFNFSIIRPHKRVFDARQMIHLYSKADICISGGGQTTHELARCGVPGIGVCFADNQIMNLRGSDRLGFMELAGWYDAPDLFKKIERTLGEILNYEKRLRMSRAGQKSVDGQGVNRMISVLRSGIGCD